MDFRTVAFCRLTRCRQTRRKRHADKPRRGDAHGKGRRRRNGICWGGGSLAFFGGSRRNGRNDRTTDAAVAETAAFSRPKAAAAALAPPRHSRDALAPRKSGFTLVEVIVVLVILAILAAIAIPALTGYIEKAKWQDFALRMKTQMTAIQTMCNLQLGETGAVENHAADADANSSNYFYAAYAFDVGFTSV
ncbi:MAG: prepilin-type N-terminal cleavage/methylation domain-containing protein, partial [Clostridiales Family XIII bacterium]|nr:prepilin-type N-terminal cleavage/methylation domain-containing protein [Clostridiales Family XIII bacterium]